MSTREPAPAGPAEERWAGESPAEIDFEENADAAGVRHHLQDPGPQPDDDERETGSRMPGEGHPTSHPE